MSCRGTRRPGGARGPCPRTAGTSQGPGSSTAGSPGLRSSSGARTPRSRKRVSARLHALDFDPRLLEQLEPLVAPIRAAVVDLRGPAVDDELRARHARLACDEDDLPRVVHADLNQCVLL